MKQRPGRALLVTLVVAGALAATVPSAAAQSGPDPAVAIVADRGNARAGQAVTYTITVSNLGDATATAVQLSVGCSDNLQCGAVSCPDCSALSSLAPGASVTATMVAIANPCGLSLTREATVVAEVSSTSPDADASNNSARASVRLQKCHQS